MQPEQRMIGLKTALIGLFGLVVIIGGGIYYALNQGQRFPASPDLSRGPDTIRVVSPNGGETYATGDTITLKSEGGHRNDTGGITNGYFLVDANGVAKLLLYAGNAYKWKIEKYYDGTLVIPGTYKLRANSSFGPCFDDACLQTIQDDSDGTFVITQGKNTPAHGVLEGKATIDGELTYYQAMLSVVVREEKPDVHRQTPYTLTFVGMVTPDDSGAFSANFAPGTYWVYLTNYNIPDGSRYSTPNVEGLPATVTIKSGEKTTLNYSLTTTR